MIHWPTEAPARLLELAAEIPPGPWTYRRSLDGSGALIVWDDITGAAEPMAQVYAGTDVAKYLCLLSPALLFGLGAADPGQAARGLGSSTLPAQPDEPGSS